MTFENTDFRYEHLALNNPYDIKLITDFLKTGGFDYEVEEVENTMILYNLNGDIIGTGSHKGNTLKYVYVCEQFRETSAFADILNYFTDRLLAEHQTIFVFTKPTTAILFEQLGFSRIATAEPIFCVLEFGYKKISDYLDYLLQNKAETKTDKIAAIVVNCNPFTNGHKYLIEKAACENEIVYIYARW